MREPASIPCRHAVCSFAATSRPGSGLTRWCRGVPGGDPGRPRGPAHAGHTKGGRTCERGSGAACRSAARARRTRARRSSTPRWCHPG